MFFYGKGTFHRTEISYGWMGDLRMKHVYQSVKELIGNTPMVRLKNQNIPKGVHVYAKLESFNPGGSVKDRLGEALIEAGERSGELKPGGTIIEPTAGNTGIGLALAAIDRDYQVIFVVPEKFAIEKQILMRALGAEIIQTPSEEGIRGAIRKAEELTRELPNAYSPGQFSNPANPLIHYQMTGPEIWDQLDGQIDRFVAGVGSGGTFIGVAKFLKEQNTDIVTVAVQPEGSVLNGGQVGPHETEGIGMERIPEFFDENYMDKVYTVKDQYAFDFVYKLAQEEGLLVGSSSGAACYAAIEEAKKAEPGTKIVVIFPDSSERYLSKNIYRGEIG